MAANSSDAETLQIVRRWVLAAIVAVLIATEAELIFVRHFGNNNGQMIAVVLTSTGLISVGWHAIARDTMSIVVFRFLMYLFLVFGIDGLMVHYNFAAHAVLKLHPALTGLPLLYATLSGDIPLLAPGMLIQVGLLGLLYTFHHPLDVRVSRGVGSLRLRG
jgi:hypothetical protein